MAAVAAVHLVPLYYAPRITFLFALFFQALPAALVLLSTAPFLRSAWVKIAFLIPLLATPASGESWLNSINCHFWICIAVGLICATKPEQGAARIVQWGVLLLAPLCSVVSIFLAPILGLKLLIDRSPERLVQVVLFGITSLIQLVFFFHIRASSEVPSLHFIVGMFASKNIWMPYLGAGIAHHPAVWLVNLMKTGAFPAIIWVMVAAYLFFTFILVFNRSNGTALWLWLASVMVAFLSYIGALSPTTEQVLPHWAERYALAPQVFMFWALVVVAVSASGWRRRAGLYLSVWLSIVCFGTYVAPHSFFASGPSWAEEMQKWHDNPNYSPVVWPGKPWVLPMPLQHYSKTLSSSS